MHFSAAAAAFFLEIYWGYWVNMYFFGFYLVWPNLQSNAVN
jgi:hypothetical protein